MKKIFFLFILIFYPLMVYSESGGSIYYVRFDVKSVDNRIERSNLLMVAADNEFRQENFSSFVITGSADYRATGAKGVNLETRAAHNAIRNFLESNGLQSVKSQSTSVNGLAHDQTVVSFEGAVRLPYKIVKSTFNEKTAIYSVAIELRFAPLAFPDQWEKMLFKHKIKKLFNDFKSFF